MNVNAKRDNSRIKEIEIMDCTLRDGEQTNGVSFLPHDDQLFVPLGGSTEKRS